MILLDELKEVAIATIAGLIVHYVAKAVDRLLERRYRPRHMRRSR